MAKKTPDPAAAAGGSGAFRDRIREYKRIRSADLVANPLNWRQHPENQQNAMRGILEEVGIVDALLVRDRSDGTYDIIDGHLRASLMPEDEVPCLVLDVDENEARKILLTFDPLGAMAEANAANLNELLRDAEFGAEALQELVAGLAEDAGLYQTADGFSLGEPELQEDEIPEPPADPITKPGDLWILGEHRLLCGDSMKAEDVERLMAGAKAGLCFTSPPYNADTAAGDGDIFNGKKSKKLYGEQYGDNLESSQYVSFARSVLALCFEHTNGFIFWNVSYNANARHEYIEQIVPWLDFLIEQVCWKKHSAIPVKGSMRRAWEPVYIFSTEKTTLGLKEVESNFWDISNTGCQADGHKACFPVALPAKGMSLVPGSQIVYEPFCGSGTTLIAAEQLNRKCYGMEISPQYCDVIVKRWELLTGKTATRKSTE